jgi:hypothetical protein
MSRRECPRKKCRIAGYIVAVGRRLSAALLATNAPPLARIAPFGFLPPGLRQSAGVMR